MNKRQLVLLIITVVSIIALGIIFFAVDSYNKKASTLPSESSITEPELPEESESEEEKKNLYVDSNGAIYELIKEYTSNDGRKLVLLQNVETKTVSLTLKSYFDENFHLIED